MLLYGKPLAEKMEADLRQQVHSTFWDQERFVAILFFGNDASSQVYVKYKQLYGEKIGLPALVFGQGKGTSSDPELTALLQQTQRDKKLILALIHRLNCEERCVGIIIQLPLPPEFQPYKNELLSAITPAKDLDGLNGTLIGKNFLEMIDFLPATPKAVISLLDYYKLGNLRRKRVAVLWKSIIVGKPLALELLKRGAQVWSFDIYDDPAEIKAYCQSAEYIFSWTGQIDLIDETYLSPTKTQTIIDIGYGHKAGKAVGDVNFNAVQERALHISPVPWGVGPLTIASLFSNVFVLWEQRALL